MIDVEFFGGFRASWKGSLLFQVPALPKDPQEVDEAGRTCCPKWVSHNNPAGFGLTELEFGRCRHIPLGERVKTLESTVVVCFLWGASFGPPVAKFV